MEDPELYRREDGLAKRDQRNHRKMVRHKLRDMPGKLDHASVVAFKVGVWQDGKKADNLDSNGMREIVSGI